MLEIALGLAGGSERQYRDVPGPGQPGLVLKSSDRPWYYKLSEFDLEGLKDLSRDKLLGAKPPEAEVVPVDIEPAAPAGDATSPEDGGEPTAAAGSVPSDAPEPTVEAELPVEESPATPQDQ